MRAIIMRCGALFSDSLSMYILYRLSFHIVLYVAMDLSLIAFLFCNRRHMIVNLSAPTESFCYMCSNIFLSRFYGIAHTCSIRE